VNIFDIDILQKKGDLYNLDQRTFRREGLRAPESTYIVERSQEMRIDLVCNAIYGNTDNIGFLLYYNNIDNPLNIKTGDKIKWISADLISIFRIQTEPDTQQDFIKTLNRGTKVDTSRRDFVSRPTNPTINNTPTEQVIDRNGIIIIGNTE